MGTLMSSSARRGGALFAADKTPDLKQRSVRGGAVIVIAQVVTFALQTGSTIVLARMLSPVDFGLQGMVIALTGFLSMFRDAGLGVASVQQKDLTPEQASTLFWINVALGALMMTVTAAMAPLVVAFFREPRLFYMTIVVSTGFLLNGLAVQHAALLQRQMRFVAMATVNASALAASIAVGVAMAAGGFGYWALVGMTVANPLIVVVGTWTAVPWIPGRFSRGAGIRSMVYFGGTVTLNTLVVYVAYNVEKVLLGRFWGAAALGLYGRAFQLATLPVQQLNTAISAVGFPALCSIQHDAERVWRSFLKSYSIIISLTLPAAISCALFAEEAVRILLGPKWVAASQLLRLLAPTVLALALINPFGWFLQATGRARRSLHIALMIAPVVILGIAAGLRHGPAGVAMGYSAAMLLLLVPILAWSIHDTGITFADYWNAIKRPLLAGIAMAVVGYIVKVASADAISAVSRLFLELTVSLGTYTWLLMVFMEQGEMYADLISQMLKPRRPAPEPG